MTLPDLNAVAGYRRMLARVGQSVRIQRWTGQAPNRQCFEAVVTALIQTAAPAASAVARTDYSESRLGAITQTQRHVIVLAADLAEAQFPLPLKKNDKVIVQGETLTVTEVDPNTRVIAGAIDLVVVGV